MSDAAAAAGGPTPAAEPQPPRSRVPEFALCAGLAVAGIVVLIDALRLSNNVTGVDPLGPKPVPVVVAGALIVLAGVLALAWPGATSVRRRPVRTSTCTPRLMSRRWA